MELSSWECGLDVRIKSLFKSISLILGSPVELACMLSLGGYPLGLVSVANPVRSLSCLSSRSYLENLRWNSMDVNMYLKHVMIDMVEMVASGCSWMREYTLDTRLTRSRFMLHMHEHLYFFMDEIECVVMWMLHMNE